METLKTGLLTSRLNLRYFICFQTLDFLTFGEESERHSLTANLQVALKVGETNLRVLELLDRGHRRQFGVPSPTKLHTAPKPGKVCIMHKKIAVSANLIDPDFLCRPCSFYRHFERE